MAANCDPSTLANQANCFLCNIPPGMQAAVQTYLLAQIAKQLGAVSTTDPLALQTAASSFIDISNQLAVQNYLLCLLNS